MADVYPSYYNDFTCIGSKCSDSCCIGWKIDVDLACHNKHLELNKKSGDKHIDRFLMSSNPSVSKFSSIKKKKNGNCSFLDESNLCSIQRRFGEDYLPDTCQTFPRRRVNFDEINVKTLSLACPEAARLCLTKKNSMEIHSGEKQGNNFLKIVPSYLHNSFTRVGELLFNKIYFLFKDENFNLPTLIIICENMLNEQNNLEKNPEKIDSILDFMKDEFKDLSFLNCDRSGSKLTFLTDLNNFTKKLDSKWPIRQILSKAHKDLVEKYPQPEEAKINFKDLEKKLDTYCRSKKNNISRNYFLNEILGNAQIFTNQSANCRNRFYLIILYSIISRLITIASLSHKQEYDEKIHLNAIQKVMKYHGFFVRSDGNQEFKLHPEILLALKKIDKNSVFNSLFLLFG